MIFRPWHALAALAVGAAAVLLTRVGPGAGPDADPTPLPPPRQQTRLVGCMGRVEPASRVRRLAAPEAQGLSVLGGLHVAEGEQVVRDQVLGWFSTREARAAALAVAEADLRRGEARRAQVQAGAKPADVSAAAARLARQRAAEENAHREFERAARLSRTDAVAAAEFDARRAARAMAEAERRTAEQELASVAEVRAVDLAAAEADVAQARAAVERARAELALAELRAPIDGTVLRIHAWPGEQVDARGVLDLADLRDIHVVAEVHETDVPRVRVGQAAAVILPGGDERIPGVVVDMGWEVRKRDVFNTDPIDEIDARVVEARVRVEGATERLARLSHMRVQVVIGE